MSDQGYPGQGENPGQPHYGPPPGSGPQPPYGPPQYGPPPSGPPPGQPQYGQPQYGQPQHGQPQYGPPQYGAPYPGPGDTAQFGAVPPQYPTGAYPPAAGAGGGGRKKGVIAGVGALVVAAVAVLILLLAGVFSGSASAKPQDAVKKLLDAGKTGDLVAAKNVLCAQDNQLHVTDQLGQNRIKTYTIGKVAKADANNATVAATVVTSDDPTPKTESLPVVKEGGRWKVCLSKLALTPSTAPSAPSDFPSEPSIPTDLPSVPLTAIPSVAVPSISAGGINACQYATSAGEAATIYVAAAETGNVSLAQNCVADGAVPRSVAEGLQKFRTSDPIVPTPTMQGDVASFKTVSGNHVITVKVERSGSGYAVTGVHVS